MKEQNRIATENITRKILKAGYGRGEADARSEEVSGYSLFAVQQYGILMHCS